MGTVGRKLVHGANKIVNLLVGLVLVAVLLYSGYALWDAGMVYYRAELPDEIVHYKPDISNPTLSELQAINPDICAWLMVEDTHIDFPVLYGQDNSWYLNHDIYGRYSMGGSVFMDCQNSRDFNDAYSLLYGHHMDGGSMFGDVKRFEDKSYFDEHTNGWLILTGKTYQLKIYAFLHVDAYQSPVFQMTSNEADYQRRLDYIKETAKLYREIGVTFNDKIIALTTCSSATTNGRAVVVAQLVEYGEGSEEH